MGKQARDSLLDEDIKQVGALFYFTLGLFHGI
jgi:hypothetical protein